MRSDLTDALGIVIRRQRMEKGLSQEKLAEMSGVHTNYIGLIERGKRAATLEVIDRIASALKVGLLELIRDVVEERRHDPSRPGSTRRHSASR